MDIVETGCEGNKAIINYNNPEGWQNYMKLSEIIKKFKNINDRQSALKQTMHRLDKEYFGMKYKKSKSSGRKIFKDKAKEIKELSDYVRVNRKTTKDRIQRIKGAKSVTEKL